MKFLKFWFPVLVYCCIIFSVSAIPSVELPSTITNVDKFVHAFEYSILAVLFSRALRNTNQKASVVLLFTLTVLFVAFYGFTDEFHQLFVIGRSSDIHDWMADMTGGIIGSIIYLYWNKNNSNVRG